MTKQYGIANTTERICSQLFTCVNQQGTFRALTVSAQSIRHVYTIWPISDHGMYTQISLFQFRSVPG